jgi:hypothetical protein
MLQNFRYVLCFTGDWLQDKPPAGRYSSVSNFMYKNYALNEILEEQKK